MATRNYDTARPQDATTAANVIGTEIQYGKGDLQERLIQGGHKFAGIAPPAPGANEVHDGKHAVGYETQTDQNESGYVTLAWSFDGTTPYLRVYGATHATKAGLIEALNGAELTGTNITTGLDPGHLHTQGGVIGGRAGTILSTGVIRPSAYRWSKGSGEGTQTIVRFDARVGTAPSGGALVIEVRKKPAPVPGNTDDVYDTAGVSTTVLGTITIAAGEYAGSVVPGGPPTLIDGDVLVLNVLTLNGTPADLSVSMVVEG